MITIRDLQKRFRKTEALCGVNLDVPAGKVTAFLGPNGSGKTTTIKCAMNLMDPDAGRIDVLGVSPAKLKAEHWQRIGYVSENQRMPEWMSVAQLLNYVRPMYGSHWDRAFEKKMLRDFELPEHTKLKSLSRGQKMKAALLSSLAYRPQLVVLDEPFAGLDPLVREEFLSGLLELTETEGWTVWISSHDMEEVDRFADRVAVIDHGRVHLEEDVAIIHQRFRTVELVLSDETLRPPQLPEHWIDFRISGRSVRFTDTNYDESSSREQCHAVFANLVRHEARPMNLREIFISLAREHRTLREVTS
ncbi:MAG: ABC transporter ATP-binding protein [Akkermansiaceae bacterium]|jgi:ABC-2 type transport system ATP-binding protein|nr:ABC transporter ATP-binding protein [Akkermansiaceae bacterium]